MAKKYIDADRLNAKIERYIKDVKDAGERLTPNMGFFDAKLSGIYDVMSIVASLQQEQPVEGLEEAAGEYATKWHKRPDGSEWKCIFPKGAIRDFIAGAEWMKDKMTVHIPSVWREEDIKKSPSMCSWASIDDGKYEHGEKYYDADGNEITKEEYEALVGRPTD